MVYWTFLLSLFHKSISDDYERWEYRALEASLVEWVVPAKIAPGRYTVSYRLDSNSKVNEFNEANNIIERTFLIVASEEDKNGANVSADGNIVTIKEGVKNAPATVDSASGVLGDLNSDGVVDIFDLVLVARDFGKTGGNLVGDINSDRKVDVFDLTLVGQNWTRK